MFNRIVRTALEAFFPGDANGLPSFRSLGTSRSFVREVFATSPFLSGLALMLSACIFWLYAAISTFGAAIFRMRSRIHAAEQFAMSPRFPRLRLLAILLRQIGAFGWLRHDSVRAAMGFAPLPPPHSSYEMGDGKRHASFREDHGLCTVLHADCLVVGAGPAGLPAAVELLKAGHRVVLIDAGPRKRPVDFTPDPYTSMRELMAPDLFTMGKAMWPILRALAVGGTAVVNSAIMVETPEDVLEEWGLPGFRIIERALTLRMGIHPVQSMSKQGVLAARILGNENPMQRAEDECIGSSECLTGCRGGKKRSPDRVWLDEFFALGGKLMSCAVAQQLALNQEGTRVVAVRGFFQEPGTKRRGEAFDIHVTDRVLLAAGVIGTTELMLRSDLKKRLPALGTRFMAHPGAAVMALHDKDMDTGGPTQDWSSLEYRQSIRCKLETLRLPPAIELARLAGGGEATMRHARQLKRMSNIVAVNWARKSLGTIHILPGIGLVVRYTMHKEDVRNLLMGLKVITKKLLEDGAMEVYPGVIGMPDVLTKEDLGQLDLLFDAIPTDDPWRMTGVLTHLFGGACWGTDPRESVARWHDGCVHHMENLHVVDASGFPKNIGVNPQLTITTRAIQITRAMLGG